MAPKMIREESAALRFTPGFTICATVREYGNRLDGATKNRARKKLSMLISPAEFGGSARREESQPLRKKRIPPAYQGLTVDGRWSRVTIAVRTITVLTTRMVAVHRSARADRRAVWCDSKRTEPSR